MTPLERVVCEIGGEIFDSFHFKVEKLLKKVRPLLLLKDSVCERPPQCSCRWPNIRFLDQTLGRLWDFSHEISHPDVTLLSSSISSWHQPSGRNAEYILISIIVLASDFEARFPHIMRIRTRPQNSTSSRPSPSIRFQDEVLGSLVPRLERLVLPHQVSSTAFCRHHF